MEQFKSSADTVADLNVQNRELLEQSEALRPQIEEFSNKRTVISVSYLFVSLQSAFSFVLQEHIVALAGEREVAKATIEREQAIVKADEERCNTLEAAAKVIEEEYEVSLELLCCRITREFDH